MQSRATRRFWRLFLYLDPGSSTGRKPRLFRGNPSHPNLRFKKVEGEPDIYSVRIGLGYRALAVMKKDRIV